MAELVLTNRSHIYVFCDREYSTDPRATHTVMMCIDPRTRPNIFLDGECVNGRVRWCVTGDPGMIDLCERDPLSGKLLWDKLAQGPVHAVHHGRVVVEIP